jgi:hypothetical protein
MGGVPYQPDAVSKFASEVVTAGFLILKQDKYGMAQRHGSLLVLLCDVILF